MKLDRALLPEVSRINFKWTDNTCIGGDIMDVYIHGDAAPGGRFKYQYIMKKMPNLLIGKIVVPNI